MLGKRSFVLIAIVAAVLTGCGSGGTSELKEAKTAAVVKPTLEVTVQVEGDHATAAITTDMKISAEHYNMERVPGEGHIHLYVDDGAKVIVTGNKYETGPLKPGKHVMKVSLHNNDHTPYDVTKEIEFETK